MSARDMISQVIRGAVLVLGLGLVDIAHAETWHTYAAIQNDVFTELLPPINDTGFTHDNVFSLRREDGDYTFGGGFVERWITSTQDRRRWDQLDLVALGERRWPYRVTTTARVGPTFGGNLGGRWAQNGWHSLTKTGPTIEQGLANNYPDDRRIGVLAGAGLRIAFGTKVDTRRDIGHTSRGLGPANPDLDSVRPDIGVSPDIVNEPDVGHISPGKHGAVQGIEGYARIDGQVAVGGVTSVELAGGGTASTRHFGAHFELAVTRYHVGDPYLALPGGYGTGVQLEWRAGVHIAWSRFRVSYQYRANEGGSGEPIGVIAFESRR